MGRAQRKPDHLDPAPRPHGLVEFRRTVEGGARIGHLYRARQAGPPWLRIAGRLLSRRRFLALRHFWAGLPQKDACGRPGVAAKARAKPLHERAPALRSLSPGVLGPLFQTGLPVRVRRGAAELSLPPPREHAFDLPRLAAGCPQRLPRLVEAGRDFLTGDLPPGPGLRSLRLPGVLAASFASSLIAALLVLLRRLVLGLLSLLLIAGERPGRRPPRIVIEVRELAPGIPVRAGQPLRLFLAEVPELGLPVLVALARRLAIFAGLPLRLRCGGPGLAPRLAFDGLARLLGLPAGRLGLGPRPAPVVHHRETFGHAVVELVFRGPVLRPAW